MPLLLAAFLLGGAGPGYLPKAHMPDGVAILPAPPPLHGAQARADRAIFAETRQLRGSARWRMAAADVENEPLERYACALGIRWTNADVPLLARLLDRIGTGAVVDPVKAHYRRQRPYLASPGPICQPTTPHLATNPDYPSGHAANGWLEGLVLAELVPERATAIFTRARAYGESRYICGAHSRSAVEAGWMAGSVTYAALHGSASFRRDMEAVRRELKAARHRGMTVDKAVCRDETRLLSVR